MTHVDCESKRTLGRLLDLEIKSENFRSLRHHPGKVPSGPVTLYRQIFVTSCTKRLANQRPTISTTDDRSKEGNHSVLIYNTQIITTRSIQLVCHQKIVCEELPKFKFNAEDTVRRQRESSYITYCKSEKSKVCHELSKLSSANGTSMYSPLAIVSFLQRSFFDYLKKRNGEILGCAVFCYFCDYRCRRSRFLY